MNLMCKLYYFVFMHKEFREVDHLFGVTLFEKIIYLSETILGLSVHTIICCSTRSQIAINLRFWDATLIGKKRALCFIKETSPKYVVSFLCLYHKIKQQYRGSADCHRLKVTSDYNQKNYESTAVLVL